MRGLCLSGGNEADGETLGPGLGDEMQWSDPRPRHIRDPKTRAQEDTLQVTPGKVPTLLLTCHMVTLSGFKA